MRFPVKALIAAVFLVVVPFVAVKTPALLILGNRFTFGIQNLTYAVVLSVAVLSLVLLVGFGGQLSLSSGFFMGVGAYQAMVAMTWLDWPALVAGASVVPTTFLLGVLLGLPALRIRGAYLALVTVTLAAVLPSLVRLPLLEGHTGGSNGLPLEGRAEPPAWLPIASMPEVLGRIPLLGPQFIGTRPLPPGEAAAVWLYFVLLACAALVFWFVRGMLRGRSGRAIRAVRDHEIGAASCGVDVAGTKVALFGWSAALAGVSGAMYAVLFRIVAPDTFGITLTIYLLFGMIAGGYRRLGGAVAGGVVVAFLPALAAQVTSLPGVPAEWLRGPTGALVLGLLLVVIPLALPDGVVSLYSRRVRARRRATSPPPPPPPVPETVVVSARKEQP
ncbi:branched-chain amino acid ABC transporter permease [Nonomuraea purpurea]|uniref:Branched-chain amino acid ABC transporter permease n=1 Tax=Nonomuraea purpurea TaxID=1849276 RepID=A0ABV8FZ06_9ACTN